MRTPGSNTRFCRYSRKNYSARACGYGRRWMVEGEGSGGAVLAEG
ncbi:MAG: hypothetical protein ACKO58_01680 [Cyanobium sp.]